MLRMYNSLNYYIFIFYIFGLFLAFTQRYNALYALKMHIRNHMQCEVSHFYKHVFYRSLNLERIQLWLPGDTYRYLECTKKFRYWYFDKNPTVNRYFQKRIVGISVFCNPVRPPQAAVNINFSLTFFLLFFRKSIV